MYRQTGLGLPTNKLAKFIYTLCMIIIFSFLSPGLQEPANLLGIWRLPLKEVQFLLILPRNPP